jgi:Uma2 family endonuclease
MEATTDKKVWTEEELLALEHPGHKCELVNGEIVISPVHPLHDIVCMTIARFLGMYVSKKRSGYVLGSNAGFYMTNGNLRCPDVSFLSKERAKTSPAFPREFFPGSPELVVEVLSPNDTFESLHEKLVEYFDSGCQLAWVVNPQDQTVHVYYSPRPSQLLHENDRIDGAQVLPGFTMSVAEIFEDLKM